MNNLITKIKNNHILNKIQPFIDEETYIVGGFVRDLLLGKESSDIDLVVKQGNAQKTAKKIADMLNAYFVTLDEKNNIYRIVFENKQDYIDIADIEGADIYSDLSRRDFSINAIAINLHTLEIIDKYKGVDCIKNKVIKEISEYNLKDDPIRLLRAFRFHSCLGFKLDEGLKKLIQNHGQMLKNTATERINAEIIKLFLGKNCAESLKEMDKYNLLEIIFPEIKDIKKIPPNSHHHLCLLEHCLEVVNQVQKYYESASIEVKNHFEEIVFGSLPRLAYLKLAAFLHDIGKPATWEIDEKTGRHRFIKHDDIGSKIVEKPLKNLKFSNKQIKYIQKIIKYHLYPANVANLDISNEKAVLRFYRKMENEVIDLIAIAHADRLSARGPDITEEMVESNINGLKNLLNRYLELKNSIKPLPKLLSGNEIMAILNIKPSPELGQIIELLKEAQISSEVITKDDAIKYIKSLENKF